MASNTAVKREGSFTKVGADVRIEAGPARVQARATNELLSNDLTAEHYQPGLADADGKPIELGKQMTYLDWKGEPGFYVYQWEAVEGHPDQGVFRERGFYTNEDEALTFAKSIAGK